MRTSCPTSSPVADAPVPELLGALLKVAGPAGSFLEMGGVTSGNRTKAYLGAARAAASSAIPICARARCNWRANSDF